jgi:dipeptidyl-peptidase-4
MSLLGVQTRADEFNKVPSSSKWLNNYEVLYSYDGSFTDGFAVNAKTHKVVNGVKAPEKFVSFPVNPSGAVNLTYSPDSTKLAFTRNNDLYVVDIASKQETRLTNDGTELILNGYASWVYYEEILGRPSKYRAFWWSPDSKTIAYYHFDNTQVHLFPIYSPFNGQDGKLINTRYPKAGEPNPKVKIGFVNVSDAKTVWADFNQDDDQYFGIPFWGSDSKEFFVAHEPRLQNTLDLYSVNPSDGSKKHIYKETYKTWLDWIDGMVFTDKGLYMARSFETGWAQVYFLSYDGKQLKRLTSGENWDITIVRADSRNGDVFFTAKRDSKVRKCLYKVDVKGNIKALTDTSLDVQNVSFSPDGKYFTASLSNYTTPTQLWLKETLGKKSFKVADIKGTEYNASKYALPQLIYIENDGFKLPAQIVYPVGFDASKKYPVHVDIYGGPDTPMVNDHWSMPDSRNQWWSQNGIIEVTADCRASGQNGRAGLDQIYKHLNDLEVKDFIAWGKYLQSLPYVKADKIGVEGFSFGGTMTTMLLCTASQYYHYGIAGGGVYDWALYDTHYTERFMDTPQSNPDGYAKSKVINYVKDYPSIFCSAAKDTSNPDSAQAVAPVMLKITHGTGDDNVHFQQTEQLIDEMQKQGKKFEFMIYPDGKHGYRGYQSQHFLQANRDFWLKYLN